MANILGLALKVNADASGFNLDPVSKALERLGTEADKAATVFEPFAKATAAAADAQAQFQQRFDDLAKSLQDKLINAKEYSQAFASLKTEAAAAAQVFADGAATTAKYADKTVLAEAELAKLEQQFKAGAITQDIYKQAVADVTGETAKAAAAEAEREQFLRRAAELTKAVVTPLQTYDAAVQELNQHLAAGTITQDTYDKNLAQAEAAFAKAESAAQGYDKAAEGAGKAGTLAFNELSGILSAIPGPIGNIAGRLSGLSSAAEGLGRIFSGGLGSGFASLAASATALLNPFTLAVAGVAALGAAAAAVGAGLSALATRVESLSNLASRLGTSFEFTQVLEDAAKRSGVSVDTLASGMQRLAVNLDEARSGSGKAAEAFNKLGISQEELQKTAPADLAGRVAEALKGIEDPATRAGIAVDLLGKSGLELLPAFASVTESTQAMEKFRAKISEVDVERLAQLDGIFDNIGTALQGLGTRLLLPFTELAAGVAEALVNVLSGVTRFIDPVLSALTPLFDQLGKLIAAFSASWADAAEAVGNSIGGIVDFAVRFGTVVGVAVQKTVAFVSDLANKFGEFTGIGNTLNSVTQTISAAFQGLWDGIKNVVSTIGGFIQRVLQFAEDWLGIKTEIETPVKATFNLDTADAEKASEEFQKTLDGISQDLETAKNEAVKFGAAGFDAAVKYEESLNRLKSQLDAGILNETSYRNEVQKVTQSFNQHIDAIRRRADEEAAAAKKILEDNKKISDGLLEQLRIEKEFGGDSGRAKAAENVKAIEAEILRVEQEQAAARANGDQAGADAAAARLGKLDQVLAKERDIASGAAAEREAERKRAEEAQKEIDKQAEERKKKEAEIQNLLDKNAEDIAAKREELANRLYDLELKRIEEINSARGGGIAIGDVRTNQGADTFLNLLGGKQDEAIDEYRKSVNELKGLRKDINKLEAKRVEILGGVG